MRVHHHHHHHDDAAAEAAERLEASAFTVGRDVYFARGSYRPHTPAGRRLLAHEFAHVIQQREAGAPRVQRRIREDVTAWTATTLGPPVPVNGADPRMITIPPTGQILITADVDVHGDPADPCSTMEVGTTQTAWMASTVMIYRGRTSAEGSVVVRHNAAMPQGDPGPAGSVWYDPVNVRRPAACGGSVQIRHVDSPWHSPPKARNNAAVAGNPLNYLILDRLAATVSSIPHPAAAEESQPWDYPADGDASTGRRRGGAPTDSLADSTNESSPTRAPNRDHQTPPQRLALIQPQRIAQFFDE